MSNPNRNGEPPIKRSEQNVLNSSFDEVYGVLAIALLAENGGTLVRVQADSSGNLVTSTPAGGATSAKQDTGNTSLSNIDTKTPALGQALASASTPVVLPASQITTLTPPTTITANAGTNLNTSTLATSTNITGGGQKTQVVDGSGNVIGATSNALDINIKSGNISGFATSTKQSDGTAKTQLVDSAGDIADVVASSGTPTVKGVVVVNPDGSNIGGGTGGSGTQYTEDAASAADPVGNMGIARRRDTLSATEVSADGDNIALNATAKGELYVKHTDSIPVTGTFFQATQPVSGTVTSNIGTTNGLALDATLTSGTQKTKLIDSAGVNAATITSAGSQVIQGYQPSATVQSGITATGAQTAVSVANLNIVTLTLRTFTGTTPTISFKLQASEDGGTTWVDLQGMNNTTGTITTTATQSSALSAGTGGPSLDYAIGGYTHVRVNVTAISGTSATAAFSIAPQTFGYEPAVATVSHPVDSFKATYSLAVLDFAPIASTTAPSFAIVGSSTKTVKITRIGISGTAATGGLLSLILRRYSALSGGTSASQNANIAKHDTLSATATAAVNTYTVAATTATGAGVIRTLAMELPTPAVTVQPVQYEWKFGDVPGQALTLRGTSDFIGLCFSAIATTPKTEIYIEWTEE